MATIPASQIVNVMPSVEQAGGNALELIGLWLTTSAQVPIGSVISLPTAAEVTDYFGGDSLESNLAPIYFNGFDGSTAKPAALLFSQYPQANVPAYLRGGDISGLSIEQVQAISGTLSIIIDGVTKSGSVNLASATTFSLAAQFIADALSITGVQTAQVTASQGAAFTGTGSGTNLTVTSVTGVIHAGDAITGTGVPANTRIISQASGTTGGAGVYVTNNATTSAGDSLTTTSTTLEVTGVTSGTLGTDQVISGSGVGSDIYIASFGTGSGGVGTYITNTAQRYASTTVTAHIPGVVYDSVAGAMVVNSGTSGASSTIAFATGTAAASIKLTQATGAVVSPGAIAGVPGTFMDALVAQTRNWATFTTLFDPDETGHVNKLAFASWNNAQGNKYVYVCTDQDAAPTVANPASSSLGQALISASYSGTELIEQPEDSLNDYPAIAAFECGAVASIDFDAPEGRTTMAFRSQTGLFGDITDASQAINLLGNGYNFYGAYGTANEDFVWFYNGSISGPFKWMDSYVNQIWLNSNCQLALMDMLRTAKSIPYNDAGAALIESALADPINAALLFGAIRSGITLSELQRNDINSIAGGTDVATIIAQRGWYLQVIMPSPTVRQERGSPICNLFYTDGQSIQKINLSSIAIA